MHRVSDHLCDRHPYTDPSFKDSYNPEESSRAFGSRALEKYAELLAMFEVCEDDRVQALIDVYEFLNIQEMKFTAIQRSILSSCIHLTESISPAIRYRAAMVLSSLVLAEPETSTASRKEAIIESATKLLSDENEEVVIAACMIFQNLIIPDDGAVLLGLQHGTLEKLASMITEDVGSRSDSSDQLRIVLEVVANTTRKREGAQMCEKLPVVQPLLAILQKPVLYPVDILLNAIKIIGNAAIYNQGKGEIIYFQGVEICLRLISKLLDGKVKCDNGIQSDLLRRTTGAVMNLSTSESAKPRIVNSGAPPLARCMFYDNSAVQENASIAINSACEAPGGIDAFTSALVHDRHVLVRVLGVKCAPGIYPILCKDGDQTIKALKALTDICTSLEGSNEVIQTLGMLDTIINFLCHSESSIQKAAAAVLRTMATHDQVKTRIEKRLLGKEYSEAEILRLLVDQETI